MGGKGPESTPEKLSFRYPCDRRDFAKGVTRTVSLPFFSVFFRFFFFFVFCRFPFFPFWLFFGVLFSSVSFLFSSPRSNQRCFPNGVFQFGVFRLWPGSGRPERTKMLEKR